MDFGLGMGVEDWRLAVVEHMVTVAGAGDIGVEDRDEFRLFTRLVVHNNGRLLYGTCTCTAGASLGDSRRGDELLRQGPAWKTRDSISSRLGSWPLGKWTANNQTERPCFSRHERSRDEVVRSS
jgi:hypothetical protein